MACALALMAVHPAAAQRRLPQRTVAELEGLVSRALDSVPMPGMAVGIVGGDSLAYARGFGLADLETGDPITPASLFQIGSVTKSFTATLGAKLAGRGALAWTDAASRHVPHAAIPDGITLAHLASHTSGLPRDPPNLRREHGDYPVLAFTHFELYRGLALAEPELAPGEAWSYSNFGYGVLGHVLEMATGEPYEVLVERELFGPLGMASSTITIWPELADRLATPYELAEGRLVPYMPWDQEALAPAGGIASTVEDLGRYVAFQLAEAQGSGPIGRLQERWVAVSEALSYGMGWFVEDVPGVGEVVSIGGDVDGYVAEILLAPEHGLGTIVLANTGAAGPLPDLGRWVLASLLGDGTPAAAREARYRRGLLHQGLREWSEAATAFQGLVAGGDPDPRAFYQLGRTGALSGTHLPEAEEALRAYLRLDSVPGPSRAAARWRLGQVLEHAGRCREAADEYRGALEDDPEYGPARSALDVLRCEP